MIYQLKSLKYFGTVSMLTDLAQSTTKSSQES